MNQDRDKRIAVFIFVGILLAWTAYLILSHDSKAPITKGIELNSGEMMGVRPDEIREIEAVINHGLPGVNRTIETTGSFKPSVVLKDTTGKMSIYDSPDYIGLPVRRGLANLEKIRRKQGGAAQIKVVVAFSPGRVKNVIEGRKDAIVIQFLNKDDISQTITLPYVVKNGAVSYGFIQHFDAEL